jgi:hypothetical protein
MKIMFKTLAFIGLLGFILGVDFVGETPPKMVFVKDAQAIVGLPFTPMSAAGVARRTTRRVVATEAAVATTAAATATAAAAASTPPPTTVVVTQPPPSASSGSGVPIGTVVQALPGGCTPVVVGGASYSDCHGVFYKAAFQGNNLVYVVVPNPLN